jgi:putative serine protease PepD
MSTATAPHRIRAVPPALAVATVALLGVIALIIALVATGAFAAPNTAAIGQTTAAAPGLNAAAIYASANPGVVTVTAQTTTTTAGASGRPQQTAATDIGTGLVLDTSGNILTADHVIAGSHSVTVTLQGGATRTATIAGSDASTDVAVLRVNPAGLTLHPLALGTLPGHRVGDPVAVIGDPFDVTRSLSTGVISNLDHSIHGPDGYTIAHALQTDAAINPGNSGGPVLDASGLVIGIADQIVTGNSGIDSSTGVGFAVPIDVIKAELSQLEAGTTPAHAYLGISATDENGSSGGTGALVQSLQPGGPAASAGIHPGDLMVAIGTTKISGVSDIVATTAKAKPGDHVTITVIRNGKQISLTVTLAKQPTSPVNG